MVLCFPVVASQSLALTDAARAAKRVLGELGERKGNKLFIGSDAGSGKTELGRILARSLPEALALSLLDFEYLDAPLQATALLDAHLGRAPTQIDVEVSADVAARGGKTIIVRVPDGWRLHDDADGDGDAAHRDRQARTFFDALWRQPDLNVIVIGACRLGLDRVAFNLRGPETNTNLLFDASAWGQCAAAAHELGQRLEGTPGLMPVPVRLAVGARFLEAKLDRLVEIAREPAADAIPELIGMIARALEDDPVRKRALEVIRGLRRTLPRGDFLELLDCGPADEDLFTRCLAYGDPVQVPEAVRNALRNVEPDGTPPQAHAQMGDTYRALDGAATAPWSNPAQLEAWFEKAYHYGAASGFRDQEWNELELVGPQMYWSRARALSRDKRYSEAATVFRRCLDDYPEDDYAAHYLGQNLDWSGQPGAEAYLRRAVELSKDNVWWNARLVTHLIEAPLPRAAEEAWQSALKAIDPSGTRSQGEAWLAEHLHRWVALAWLRVGRSDRADQVLSSIPRAFVERHGQLRELRHAIDDALEADTLGHAVYAYGVPMNERWRSDPRHLDRFDPDGVDLEVWFPGQVHLVEDGTVTVAYADPEAPRSERSLGFTEISKNDWRRIATGLRPRAKLFVELGIYANGERLIVRQSERSPPDFLRPSPRTRPLP